MNSFIISNQRKREGKNLDLRTCYEALKNSKDLISKICFVKKYNFKKWSLDVYLDVQNITNNTTTEQPYFSVERDANGVPISDPNNPDYYIPRGIENVAGTIIPGIGIVVEF